MGPKPGADPFRCVGFISSSREKLEIENVPVLFFPFPIEITLIRLTEKLKSCRRDFIRPWLHISRGCSSRILACMEIFCTRCRAFISISDERGVVDFFFIRSFFSNKNAIGSDPNLGMAAILREFFCSKVNLQIIKARGENIQTFAEAWKKLWKRR